MHRGWLGRSEPRTHYHPFLLHSFSASLAKGRDKKAIHAAPQKAALTTAPHSPLAQSLPPQNPFPLPDSPNGAEGE